MSIKKFSIAVDIETVNVLDTLAKKTERSRNWLINKAINEFLEKEKVRKILQIGVDKCE